jgi:amino acid transporter
MIAGRLNLHKLLNHYTIYDLAVKASLISGISFIAGILGVTVTGTSNKTLVIVILSISFTIAGLGSSFLGPSVMNAANTRSKFPSSVVIGQIGVGDAQGSLQFLRGSGCGDGSDSPQRRHR